MKFFTTPNSKNIIATLRIVTLEKHELTFLLILHFHNRLNVVIEENLEIDSNGIFSDKAVFEQRKFFYSFQSLTYNNVVVIK